MPRLFPPPPDLAWTAGRVAVVGIGNELNGDDGAGVAIVRLLKQRVPRRPDLLLLDGGTAPENLTGALRTFNPNTVLLVDVADFGGVPGAIAWLPWEESDGLSASSHTLPPSVLCRYLIHEFACRMMLLGVQPQRIEFGEPLTAAVRNSVHEVVTLLARSLTHGRGEQPISSPGSQSAP